jgi:hypothetical protein
MAEAVRDGDAPVPVGLGVGLGVDLAECDGGVYVEVFVIDPKIEHEVGPVRRKRVEDLLEVAGERHGVSVVDRLRRRRPAAAGRR